MLALYSYFFFHALTRANPITSDFSSWYAGSTFFVVAVLMGLAIYGFYTSLAGKRLLKGNCLKVETFAIEFEGAAFHCTLAASLQLLTL